MLPAAASVFTGPRPDPRLSEWLGDFPGSLFNDRLYQSIELMEAYSIELSIDLLRRLGVSDQLGDWRSPGELTRILSLQPRFGSAVGWLLERCVETGCIERRFQEPLDAMSSGLAAGNVRLYRLTDSHAETNLGKLREAGLNIHAGNRPTLDLLDYAASLYPAVSRGEVSGEEALFAPQGIALWLKYFDNDNLTYAVNNSVAALVASRRLRDHSNIRILEVGAGAGSASEVLLRVFDEHGLLGRIQRYVITEPNAFFRRRAQRELSSRYSHVPLEWGVLDVNSDWANQHVGRGEFDLVYGVNVLHVAKDLSFSLRQARIALAAAGWFVIGECIRPYPSQPIYTELIFQILDTFNDVDIDPELRPNPGFLTPRAWRHALYHAGFESVEVSPNVEGIRELYRHFFTAAISGRA